MSSRLGHRLVLGLLTTLAVLAAACGGSSPSAVARSPGSGAGGTAPPTHGAPTTSTAPPTTTTTTTVPPTTTTTTEPPGWTAVAMEAAGPAIDQQTYTASDGAQVTVFRFRAGRVHFDLHDGSEDPPAGSATLGPNAGSAIGQQEQPLLLAAFNGGFKADTGAGGTEINGQVLTPLTNGLASFVIDADGSVHIGVWGANVPAPGEQVSSVRQNLAPLVASGQPSPDAGSIGAWGATLGGGAAVARSALGQDAQGNILYAGSMSAVPGDLAAALVNAGAQVGMELDINPEWVQLDYAASAGAPLQTGIPGQNRPASQFQSGWTRDFVTVLASQ